MINYNLQVFKSTTVCVYAIQIGNNPWFAGEYAIIFRGSRRNDYKKIFIKQRSS